MRTRRRPRTPVRLIVAALAAVAAVAVPARAGAAASTCSPIPKNPLVPHLLSPCDGAALHAQTAVTFKVYDGDPEAATTTPPLILVSASRKLSHGHLAAPPPLGGDFHALASEAAAPTEFTYTSPAHRFPQWWENTPGTYYVQIRQADPRAGAAGRFYSPITTIRIR
jgi:hypothetical protein